MTFIPYEYLNLGVYDEYFILGTNCFEMDDTLIFCDALGLNFEKELYFRRNGFTSFKLFKILVLNDDIVFTLVNDDIEDNGTFTLDAAEMAGLNAIPSPLHPKTTSNPRHKRTTHKNIFSIFTSYFPDKRDTTKSESVYQNLFQTKVSLLSTCNSSG